MAITIIRTGSDGRLRYTPAQRGDLLEAFDQSGMSNQDDLSVLLPSNWQPATTANKPIRETCPA